MCTARRPFRSSNRTRSNTRPFYVRARTGDEIRTPRRVPFFIRFRFFAKHSGNFVIILRHPLEIRRRETRRAAVTRKIITTPVRELDAVVFWARGRGMFVFGAQTPGLAGATIK